MQSISLADTQDRLQAEIKNGYEEMKIEQNEILGFLQELSGVAKLWRGTKDFVHGVFQKSTLFRFVLYFCLTFGCIFPCVLLSGWSVWAVIGLIPCCFGMLATRLHVRPVILTMLQV